MKELFTSMLQALSDGQSVVLCSILASAYDFEKNVDG